MFILPTNLNIEINRYITLRYKNIHIYRLCFIHTTY